MPRKVSEVMTPAPIAMPLEATLAEAARAMRDGGVGAVLVTVGGELAGILTDRDIAVRAVAEHRDPASTPLGEVCSAALTTVHPDDDLDTVVMLMRRRAVRRLPVVADGALVGLVSLGDLAAASPGAAGLVMSELGLAKPGL